MDGSEPLANSISRERASLPQEGTVSLGRLFQLFTVACVFFAFFKTSPAIAFLGLFLFIPPFLRTWMSADRARLGFRTFGWKDTVVCFIESTGIEMLTLLIALLTFILVCIGFAIFSMIFGLLIGSGGDLIWELGVLGAGFGLAWGFAGAILSLIGTSHFWTIQGK